MTTTMAGRLHTLRLDPRANRWSLALAASCIALVVSGFTMATSASPAEGTPVS